jgi:hypothetical protein
MGTIALQLKPDKKMNRSVSRSRCKALDIISAC